MSAQLVSSNDDDPKKHSTKGLSMLLYLDKRRAPNPRKVRIYLAEKNLDIPIKEIDLHAGDQKTPEFLAKNPFAGVPILELDDGTVLI